MPRGNIGRTSVGGRGPRVAGSLGSFRSGHDNGNLNQRPAPNVSVPVADPGGPYNGTVDVELNFDGSGSLDPGGSIAAYDWDWGDGTAHGTTEQPSHTYTTDDEFTVTLTVTDSQGTQAVATTTATIAVA